MIGTVSFFTDPNTVFRETKAINLGVWGRAPRSIVRIADTFSFLTFCFWNCKRVSAGDAVLVILIRRQLR